MNSIYKLNPSNVVSIAKELTIKAIENDLITPSDDSEDTAQSVLKFFHTLVDHLND